MKLLQNISLNSNKMVVKRCYLPNWDIIYDKECTTLFSKGQTDPDMQRPWSNNICSLCTTCNKQISSVPWKCKIDCTRLYWEKGLESSLLKMPNFMNFFLSRCFFVTDNWQPFLVKSNPIWFFAQCDLSHNILNYHTGYVLINNNIVKRNFVSNNIGLSCLA